MKKVRVEDAVGLTLCHDLTEMRDGFKGPAFRRGHVITEADIPHMLDIGKRTVFVWEEAAGEIHEEDAALRMAAMAPVRGAHYTGPSEGKMLLIADKPGMFRADTGLLKEIKNGEDRVVRTPAEVAALSDDGIRAMVASGSGTGSSIRLRRQPKHNPTIYIRNSETGDSFRLLKGLGTGIRKFH